MAVAITSLRFNVALMGRQKRLGAVAGGAYLSGQLRGTYDLSVAWDHRRKRYEIAALGVEGPLGWDGERLWAECEKREARADAIYGRRIIAAIPYQLSREERVALARKFARTFRERFGVAVEWSIHQPPQGGDERNWHLHLQFSSRPISDDGVWVKCKVREWDTGVTKRQALCGWRAEWECLCNSALEAAGVEDRITLASFASRGIRGISEQPQRHRGMKATDQARRTKKKDDERLQFARRRRRTR